MIGGSQTLCHNILTCPLLEEGVPKELIKCGCKKKMQVHVWFKLHAYSFASKKHIAEQGSKAIFSLLRKIKCSQLPFDIQIDLFNKIVKPVLLYGSEIWRFGNLDILERVQFKFYKYIFNLKTSTPSAMIYGELGILPLRIDIQCRMISFWARINEDVEENERKLSPMIYKLVYNLQNTNNFKSQWIDSLGNLICSLGFGGIWYSQSFKNKTWFVKACNQKLKDIFTQEWFALIEASSSSNIYQIIKTKFEQSSYISQLSPYHTKHCCLFEQGTIAHLLK